MKAVYLLVVALAVPLIASGQDTKNKVNENTNVFVQDNTALDLFTTASADDNGLSWAVAGGQSGPKVDLDIKNATVGEALRELFSKGRAEYKLEDKDIPDTRISLTAKQVRFSTALNIIMESSGLHYSVQVQNGKTTYRIGKKLSNSPNVFFDNATSAYGDAHTLTKPNANFDVYRNAVKVNPQLWTNSLTNKNLRSLT